MEQPKPTGEKGFLGKPRPSHQSPWVIVPCIQKGHLKCTCIWLNRILAKEMKETASPVYSNWILLHLKTRARKNWIVGPLPNDDNESSYSVELQVSAVSVQAKVQCYATCCCKVSHSKFGLYGYSNTITVENIALRWCVCVISPILRNI